MSSSGLLEDLVEALRCLPGVGPKSAQRMALHLLQRDRDAARRLGSTLVDAMDRVHHCEQCRIFTENTLCRWCSDPARVSSQLCIVESPADVLAIDRATDFRGKFFLLLGHLSPLDGIGPKDLGLDLLESRLETGGVDEITLATNPTVEGQATARYIGDIAARHGVTVMQIARGVPVGSELEFADGGTLAVAFSHRTRLS
ncbi:recombination mediator RecR [Granulosicoccus antarcticus]|uniref:Recombination protein RecR n=1 Tax=Granulosicoccus antarcticus IMCC3135 TaxID=1192854 RepID=A0A2Z2NZZ8_9GAMM|nr:recombination mediator RecR [Granulosicoccus antarcticus]ASJ74480.1 Recombination protein RecR [Granulosicoccus antarcticus IMCC3135]